jgi:cytoskeletal protein RodZ
MKVRKVMLKHGSFRPDSSSGTFAGLKSPLVVALCGLLLIQPATGFAQEPVQSPQASQSATTEISSSQPPDELPSAPVPQAAPQQGQSQPSQPAQQPSAPPQAPVGTAAAPYEKPTGVPGSRPAGAAIAPAKQRRVRAIVISLGLVLAGAGAIGAIAGLSKASHSQP